MYKKKNQTLCGFLKARKRKQRLFSHRRGLGKKMHKGQFGYLLGSSGPDMIVMPGGSVGNLCLSVGADFGRYVAQIQQFSPTGIACTVVDFSAIPTAFGPRSLFSGDSWYFQMWYRDGNTSNFTPALEVVIP